MPEDFLDDVPRLRTANAHDERIAQLDDGPAATSALRGHVDYADLAERVVQGVSVRMHRPASPRPEPTKPDATPRRRHTP